MQLTLKEVVERLNAYLKEHPEHADCEVFANQWDDSEFNSQGSELVIEFPDGQSDTLIDLQSDFH